MTAPSILYTQDDDLARRMEVFLRTRAPMRHVTAPDRLEPVLQQSGPALLIMDLRAKEVRELLDQIPKKWPRIQIIALGLQRTEPLRSAQYSDIFAAEELSISRRPFQMLITRALNHLRLMEENRDLRESAALALIAEPPRLPDPAPERHAISTRMPYFPRVFRRFDNAESLFASVVEGAADAAGVTRAGIFSRVRPGDPYRFRAGLRCLPETAGVEYGERDPLVRWLELHGHVICRSHLAQTLDQTKRAVMERALDAFGAEVIVPLHGRGHITGWLFFGHRATGQRFDYQDLENLMFLAEHVSTVIENAHLHDELTLQKTLAETLLTTMPLGFVATDHDAVIRWFNPTAEKILGISAASALEHPAEAAGGRIAGFLRDALAANADLPPRTWVDINTRRLLGIETRRLFDQTAPLGVVAVIHDLTAEDSSRQKQDLLDRALFWTDLAASMSHEIRNPLVAIKTFAQLLPERFEDADFRKDFNSIVVQEIDRLDRIMLQINDFAHPPELEKKPIDIRAPVRRAVEVARERFGVNGTPVEINMAQDMPNVLADETALVDAFAHLVANAAESLGEQKKPRITLVAKTLREGRMARGVVITVEDNGKGIDPELKEKIFSPFCTTKARGMGLGLPIVKRTVFDHNGRVDVDSSPHGTSVKVMLPAIESRV